MERYDIYKDIAKRTGGDIYIGVVGPVRTGKSTFIAGFMDNLVMPNIANKNKKQIAVDEMPQSGQGKTITTTEPKFIPGEAVKISLKGKATAKVRLIDCVGYMVDGAIGHEENGAARMVKTPWSSDPVPFEKAAEIGTRKVIADHSTIGILVTTDGSFTEIPRKNYEPAEERSVAELKAIGKPFVIVLNTKNEGSSEVKDLSASLEKKYEVPVVIMNVITGKSEDFMKVFEKVLMEFPIKSFDVILPDWMQALPGDSKIIGEITDCVRTASASMSKMKDYPNLEQAFSGQESVESPNEIGVYPGDGKAECTLKAKEGLFYKVLSEECGDDLTDDYRLMSYVKQLSVAKNEYVRLKQALNDAEENGYGIVLPSGREIEVEEPELIKRGGRYGVRIKAKAESLHIIKISAGASVSPMVGTEKQCMEFIEFLKNEGGEDKGKLLDTNVFGKPLYELVDDELSGKMNVMPDSTKIKLRKSLNRMVNEGKYRIICLLI